MSISNQLKNQHLLWRAGFGPMAEMVPTLHQFSQIELWQMLVQSSKNAPEKITSRALGESSVSDVKDGVQDLGMLRETIIKKGKVYREDLKEMNINWLNTMVNSGAQSREKMAFFWHGHFATRQLNSPFQRDLLHTIRTNALGNFGTLLKAVAKSPAMLQFLNNQQNRKRSPNENFAREVMELFTMGRGNYTEMDIKEAARAFTGWGFNAQGDFVFRQFQHDGGEKTILGSTGYFTGDDVLDILLKQKQTAVFITRKLYKFLVNETVDEAIVQKLATGFYQSDYELMPLLHDIFTSSWFYEEKNIGTKIKSPIELMVGIRRMLPIKMQAPELQLQYQKLLGQILFFPPNVAGWPGGKSWIDTSTLMARLQLPQVLTLAQVADLTPKGDDDLNMGANQEQSVESVRQKMLKKSGVATSIDWPTVLTAMEPKGGEDLLASIQNKLLQNMGRPNAEALAKAIDSSSQENLIKSAVPAIMSTPEYQLC